jgi:hypothetical protein
MQRVGAGDVRSYWRIHGPAAPARICSLFKSALRQLLLPMLLLLLLLQVSLWPSEALREGGEDCRPLRADRQDTLLG